LLAVEKLVEYVAAARFSDDLNGCSGAHAEKYASWDIYPSRHI
jgi:hypothetical protein